MYKEKHRPQIHFTAKHGWLNDPNGLVYKDRKYHLFFQHNPYGWSWGNMHWGHTTSTDLLHWKEQPIALYPFAYQDHAFSGSAVVDKNNTSGFGVNGKVPLVVAFTSTGRGECIRYSLDDGQTFKEYEGNPVLKHDGRDPKIFWYEPGKHWVMVVFDNSKTKRRGETIKKRVFQIYNSKDLKHWTYQSENDNYWECPELFELPVDGDSKNKKWVMYGGNSQYQVGSFDGKKFVPETTKQPYHKDVFYASQVFNNTPDGRKIQIGWSSVKTPGMPFNSMMSFPTSLSLQTTPDGIKLRPKPIKEIETLHQKQFSKKNILLLKDNPLVFEGVKNPTHIILDFETMDSNEYGIEVFGMNSQGDMTYSCHPTKKSGEPY